MQPLKNLPPQTVGEIGRMLASAEILKRGIGVAKPEQDTGFDIVSISQAKACRIQVKTRGVQPDGISETFSVRRRKVSGVEARDKNRTYGEGEIDVFVFVSLATNSFWVVPAASLNLESHKISLRQDSPWLDAWHVLTEQNDAA